MAIYHHRFSGTSFVTLRTPVVAESKKGLRTSGARLLPSIFAQSTQKRFQRRRLGGSLAPPILNRTPWLRRHSHPDRCQFRQPIHILFPLPTQDPSPIDHTMDVNRWLN